VSEKIKCGEMVQLFGDYSPGNRGIYAIYPHKRYLPAKVRVFVDFMHGWFKTHTAQE
jgi:DNA-binding transcriptional LysR family regulator